MDETTPKNTSPLPAAFIEVFKTDPAEFYHKAISVLQSQNSNRVAKVTALQRLAVLVKFNQVDIIEVKGILQGMPFISTAVLSAQMKVYEQIFLSKLKAGTREDSRPSSPESSAPAHDAGAGAGAGAAAGAAALLKPNAAVAINDMVSATFFQMCAVDGVGDILDAVIARPAL